MTQEEKQLLIKDLCARLPYGVIIEITSDGGGILEVSYDMRLDAGLLADLFHSEDDFKPYLRSMSSMTEEESKEFALLQTDFYIEGFLYPIAAINMVNWLNSHHFDYCGLIERGLALEALEGMYHN